MKEILYRTLAIGLLLSLTACGGGGSGGSSSSSSASSSVSAPDAPTIGTATAGDGSASIAFTAASSGGTATSFTATCTAGSDSQSGTGSSSPITVSGLTNGTAYSCSVTATNSAGTSAASASVSVTPAASVSGGSTSTASVDCPYSESYYVASIALTSNASWSCSSTTRTLSGNGIPDHDVGTFPNSGNPNTISTQSVSFSATLTPEMASSDNTDLMIRAYALNSVKFDPATAGTCPSTASSSGDCRLDGNTYTWNIEALGQTTFDFGVDSNNAHVQPSGAYHYHGVPTGMITNAGASDSSMKMVLLGWAPDGFPVYGPYGHTTATDASSALKIMSGSYQIKSTPDSGRPATSLFPMGTFTQDYEYVAGSGDLDECNGRFDVTPEFPSGIYHYYATENSYPYLPRCWRGVIN